MRATRVVTGWAAALLAAAALAQTPGGRPGDAAWAPPAGSPPGHAAGMPATAAARITKFSFLAYGDNRAGGNCDGNAVHIALVKRMVAEKADFVFNLGDMVAGIRPTTNWVNKGTCSAAESHGSFKDMIAPLANKPPPPGLPMSYFPVVGNHDDNWNDKWYPDAFGNGFCDVFDPRRFIPNHTRQRYFGGGMAMSYSDSEFYTLACSKDPRDRRAVYPNYMYYSFDFGNAHFTVMRLNSDYDDLEECNNRGGAKNYDNCFRLHQLDWLRADLDAAAARAGIEHLFVLLHAPVFTSSDGHAAQVSWPVLAREFSRHRVKIVFSGHNHVYERSHPIYAPEAPARSLEPAPPPQRDDARGTVYTVTGGAGSPLNGFRAEHPLIARRDATNHYLRIDVDGSRIAVKAVQLNGGVLDAYAR